MLHRALRGGRVRHLHQGAPPAAAAAAAAASCSLQEAKPALVFRRHTGGLSATPLLLAPSSRPKKYMPKMRFDGDINPLAKATNIDPKVLYLVTVPIGNLKDFTLRALDVLRSVDYVICSDLRATRVLMELIDIDCSGRLIQFNRSTKNHGRLVDLIRSGSSAAFVVPQGTPCVGDFGSGLVRDMLGSQVRVSCVPGADACTTALAMSGCNLSADGGSFRFGGFLSTKRGQRISELRIASAVTYPSVYFEAGNRLLDTLADIAVVAPRRRVAVTHEMTKVHEGTHAGPVESLLRHYERSAMSKALLRGQITVVMDGAIPEAGVDPALAEAGSSGGSLIGQRRDGASNRGSSSASVGVDGDNIGLGGDGLVEGAGVASNDAAALERSFVHFSVVRNVMAAVAGPEDADDEATEAALRATATALRMPLGKVRRLFEDEEARIDASPAPGEAGGGAQLTAVDYLASLQGGGRASAAAGGDDATGEEVYDDSHWVDTSDDPRISSTSGRLEQPSHRSRALPQQQPEPGLRAPPREIDLDDDHDAGYATGGGGGGGGLSTVRKDGFVGAGGIDVSEEEASAVMASARADGRARADAEAMPHWRAAQEAAAALGGAAPTSGQQQQHAGQRTLLGGGAEEDLALVGSAVAPVPGRRTAVAELTSRAVAAQRGKDIVPKDWAGQQKQQEQRLKDFRLEMDRQAAEDFLHLRQRLRGEADAEQAIAQAAVASAMAKGGATVIADHVPGDWEADDVPAAEGDAEGEEETAASGALDPRQLIVAAYQGQQDGTAPAADADQRAPVGTAYDDAVELTVDLRHAAAATSNTDGHADGSTKVPPTKKPKSTSSKKAKKKVKPSAAALRKRLKLQRQLDVKREHLRLLQMGMGAAIVEESHAAEQNARRSSRPSPAEDGSKTSFGSPYMPPSPSSESPNRRR